MKKNFSKVLTSLIICSLLILNMQTGNIVCAEETIQNTAFENLKTILPKNDEELELVFEGDYKGKKITLSFSYAESGYNGTETIGVTVNHEGETLFLTLLLIANDEKAVVGVHNEELIDIAFLEKKNVIFNEEISLTWGTTNIAESLRLSTPELNEKVEEQLKALLLILQNFLHKSNIDATIQELGFENAKTEIVIESNGNNLCIAEHEKDKYLQSGVNVEADTQKIYVYALDGRIEHIDEKDKDAFLSVGWYSEPMMYVYAADGRKQPIPTRQLQEWIAVGWYDSPVVEIYAEDGRTMIINQNQLEAYKKVGWYNGKPIRIYSSTGNGYSTLIGENERNYYIGKGWYDDRTIIVYAPDGRTECIEKSLVDAWKQVGWYTTPVQYMYSLDGKTAVVEKKLCEEWKKNGWFDSTNIMVYAADGRTRTINIKDAKAWLNVGWYTQPVTDMYFVSNGAYQKITVAKSDVEKYKKSGWKLEFPNKKIVGYKNVVCSSCEGTGNDYYQVPNTSPGLKWSLYKTIKKDCDSCNGDGLKIEPVYYYYY